MGNAYKLRSSSSSKELTLQLPSLYKEQKAAGEGYAQSKESDSVVDDADGAASDSPQQMSCPICLEDINST